MDDRPRKDRLIQTRVPQDLEYTLKDEARKRRLSVSHLIRNVLEDTFSLVDNVVHEVDRVVTDSVEMAQTLKRDAQRLAATARGQTAHREPRSTRDRSDVPAEPDGSGDSTPDPHAELDRESEAGPTHDVDTAIADVPAAEPERDDAQRLAGLAALRDVYGFQELILNRAVSCASCAAPVGRGARAYLGMSDAAGASRVWVCQECIDTLGA